MNQSVCRLKCMQPFRSYTGYICTHTNGALAPFARVISSALLFPCSCVHARVCVESVLQVCEACCLSVLDIFFFHRWKQTRFIKFYLRVFFLLSSLTRLFLFMGQCYFIRFPFKTVLFPTFLKSSPVQMTL